MVSLIKYVNWCIYTSFKVGWADSAASLELRVPDLSDYSILTKGLGAPINHPCKPAKAVKWLSCWSNPTLYCEVQLWDFSIRSAKAVVLSLNFCPLINLEWTREGFFYYYGCSCWYLVSTTVRVIRIPELPVGLFLVIKGFIEGVSLRSSRWWGSALFSLSPGCLWGSASLHWPEEDLGLWNKLLLKKSSSIYCKEKHCPYLFSLGSTLAKTISAMIHALTRGSGSFCENSDDSVFFGVGDEMNGCLKTWLTYSLDEARKKANWYSYDLSTYMEVMVTLLPLLWILQKLVEIRKTRPKIHWYVIWAFQTAIHDFQP